jgi:hypothetical protein
MENSYVLRRRLIRNYSHRRAVLTVGAAGAMVAIADQPMDFDASHPAAYVNDSVITAKVKTTLAAKPVDPD